MKKRILVTGASGKLGNFLIRYLRKFHLVFPLGYKQKKNGIINTNLVNQNQLQKILSKIRPNIIIHLAAITDVDKCENNFEQAYKLNVEGTYNIVNWILKRKKVRLIYISTDQVYNSNRFSKEEDGRASNTYSVSKYLDEKIVENVSNHVIIRTNFFGYFPNHKYSFINWFLDEIRKKKKINLVSDIYFNPIYIRDLSEVLNKIIFRENIKGTFNIGSKDKLSKGMFLLKFAELIKANKNKFKFVASKNLNLKAFRPSNMTMSIKKIEKTMRINLPKLNEGIKKLKTDIVF